MQNDQVHMTGDQVTETASYVNDVGAQVNLKEGDIFPNSPRNNKSTEWKYIENNQSS